MSNGKVTLCPPCRQGDHANHQVEVMDHEPCQCPQPQCAGTGRLVLPPEPGSDVVFAGLSATAMETSTAGPYPVTRIRYQATGQTEVVPTDGLREPGKGITLSRFQLEEWAGYPLTDEHVDRLAAAIPKSSIPDAINEVAFAITLGRPELNPDDCS